MCITQKIQNVAYDVAHQSKSKYKHGAVITKGSKIIFTGCNDSNRTKILNKLHTCVHSEVDVINKLIKYLKRKHGKDYHKYSKKYTLWVVRLVKKHKDDTEYIISNSEPCYFCKKTIEEHGIQKINYSDNLGKIIKQKIDRMTSTHMSACQSKLKIYF